MVELNWADRTQAIASLLSAVFTAASLVYIAVYTSITKRAYEVTRNAFEEGARPVIVLLSVKMKGGERVAVFKNTGAGIAVNIRRKVLLGEGADSNVLAQRRILLMVIPETLESNHLEIHYESLTGKKLCTISYFLTDGRAFNEYIPDLGSEGEDSIKRHYMSVMSRASLADSKSLLARGQAALKNPQP